MTPASDHYRPLRTELLESARRLLHAEIGGELSGDAIDVDTLVSASERVVLRVTGGLARSFGPMGALALVSRALTRAQSGFPVLTTVAISTAPSRHATHPGEYSSNISGLSSAAGAHGASDLLQGITAWIAEVTDLLSELIGDELTHTLLAQTSAPGSTPMGAGRGPSDAQPSTGGSGEQVNGHQTHPGMVDER